MVGKNTKNNEIKTGKNEEKTEKRSGERLKNEDDICKNGKQEKVENVQSVKGKVESGLLDNSGCFLCGIKAGEEKPRIVFVFTQKVLIFSSNRHVICIKIMNNCLKT